MKKYVFFFLISITLCVLVIFVSQELENNHQIDKDLLFQLLVDNYCTGSGSYEACEDFYKRHLSIDSDHDSVITQLYDTLLEVKISKENYAIASRYYQSESYLNSYRYYKLVMPSDQEHYKKSLHQMTHIEQTLTKQVEAHLQNQELDAAYNLMVDIHADMDIPITIDSKLLTYIDGQYKAFLE